MGEKILPKGFFRNNPLDKFSAASIAHFTMTAGFNNETCQMLNEVTQKGIYTERLSRIAAEKAAIDQLDSGEAIVTFMRSKFDIANQQLLCRKALSMHADAVPLILHRYKTSYQDVFIDTAVYILAHAEKAYAEQLLQMYPQIRNPYARSLACLVFGVQHIESAAPLLLAEYERMKKEHIEENLCQGPLLGLYCLYGKA